MPDPMDRLMDRWLDEMDRRLERAAKVTICPCGKPFVGEGGLCSGCLAKEKAELGR